MKRDSFDYGRVKDSSMGLHGTKGSFLIPKGHLVPIRALYPNLYIQ